MCSPKAIYCVVCLMGDSGCAKLQFLPGPACSIAASGPWNASPSVASRPSPGQPVNSQKKILQNKVIPQTYTVKCKTEKM